MTIRTGSIGGALLLMASLPLAAQEPSRPPGPPPIERLEQLRLERLQESLGLTEEQTETLREQMERSHGAMRESFERQKQAMEALEESLAGRPVDQETLRRALADVQAAREQMERQREEHVTQLGKTLTLEQRAKFLLFNRQFDARLRELVERHRERGHAPPGREGGAAALRGAPGWGPERREPTREEKIESLEKRIAEMQRELDELRSGSDD
ncbi:MAG TPA: periplasmic heavy metal sensor [Gemmatimonadota bacterium]|nr:periplasmic heavy metal sensor [Gemmatimonadota bacterium]